MILTSSEESLHAHAGLRMKPLVVFVGALLPVFGSCGHLALTNARRRGPGVSSDGVAISLLYSSCDDSEGDVVQAGMAGDSESAYIGADALDLRLQVEIKNDRPEAVTIDPKGLRLVLPSGLVRPIDSSDKEDLPAGGARLLELHFWKYGAVPCRTPMRLAFDHLATVGPRPLALKPLVFSRGTLEDQ